MWDAINCDLLPHKINPFCLFYSDSVHRDHDGVYVCMADNGVGNQATANISLTVLHAPYIKMQKKLHTGKNKVKMELSCLVQAKMKTGP